MFKWAIDGVGLVVNPENPVASMTTVQAKAIFAGTIDSWKALGGADKVINLYTRDTVGDPTTWLKSSGCRPLG